MEKKTGSYTPSLKMIFASSAVMKDSQDNFLLQKIQKDWFTLRELICVLLILKELHFSLSLTDQAKRKFLISFKISKSQNKTIYWIVD